MSMKEKEGEREERESLAPGVCGWSERKFSEEEILDLNFKKDIYQINT